MDISRRFFIGGLAGCAVVGPRRIFAAEPGKFVQGRPELVFGVLSDIHIALALGGRKLKGNFDTTHLKKAFAYFRDQGADAVVIAGDMAHDGVVGELQAVAKAWFEAFPDDKAPDGRRVERVFVFGNHDWSGVKRGKSVYGDDWAAIVANALRTDPRRLWDTCFHEEWHELYLKSVKGYSFVGAHWCAGNKDNGDCNGKSETFIEGLADRYAKLRGRLDPSKPFFHVQHPHPRGTVHGNEVWGQDDGQTTRVLSAFPNAIAFSGHSHSSLIDEKSIWQGAFTSVGTATLRYVGTGGQYCELPAGYENYRTPKGDTVADALKVMGCFNRLEGKQGQLVRVYADRVVFSRRDFVNDVPLTDDLVMPLPAAESKPFAFAERSAASKAPQFKAEAKLVFSTVEAKPRGAKKKAPKKRCLQIELPPADAEPAATCVQYGVVTQGADGKPLKLALAAPGMRFPKTDPRVSRPSRLKVAFDRLAAGDLTFEVVAYNCWGRSGRPLKSVYHSV